MKKTPSRKPEEDEKSRERARRPKFTAFTIKADGPLGFILLDVEISPPPAPGRVPLPEAFYKCRAAWNTGIRRSRISAKVIEALRLRAREQDEANGAQRYLADIYLPNKIRFAAVAADRMESADVEATVECVIGMDIIRHGDCSISHKDGKTMFSFRVPSLGGVDYVELAPAPARRDVATVMVRRNQMCPCGSGKRYKNCCGKLV